MINEKEVVSREYLHSFSYSFIQLRNKNERIR